MDDKKYLKHLKGDKPEMDQITILIRDPDHQMIKFLHAARAAANPGHSYTVVIDPDSKQSQDFGFDGDGSFFIKDIKFNGKEYKEEK